MAVFQLKKKTFRGAIKMRMHSECKTLKTREIRETKSNKILKFQNLFRHISHESLRLFKTSACHMFLVQILLLLSLPFKRFQSLAPTIELIQTRHRANCDD